MIFRSNKIIKFFKKNIEVVFTFSIIFITIISTIIYNNNKILINENYKDVINNIYFKKSIDQILKK